MSRRPNSHHPGHENMKRTAANYKYCPKCVSYLEFKKLVFGGWKCPRCGLKIVKIEK